MKKKLNLNKSTVTNLTQQAMALAQGGRTCGPSCFTEPPYTGGDYACDTNATCAWETGCMFCGPRKR